MKEALKSFLKKLIIFAIVVVIVGLGYWLITSLIPEAEPVQLPQLESSWDLEKLKSGSEEDGLANHKLVTENSKFALYVDPADTDIVVVDKTTGEKYYSNPKEADPTLAINDTMLSGAASMLSLTFHDSGGNSTTFTSMKDAVGNNQMYFHKIDNGIRIVYKLGKDEGLRVIPPVLSEEGYNRIYEQLDRLGRKNLEDFYRFIDKDKIPSSERSTLLERYPSLSENSLYVVRNLSTNQKKKMEGFTAQVGFTYDDMVAEMDFAGYVPEDVSVAFVVPVDLTIDEDGFVARIVADEITTPSSYKISTLTLLNGFGATADTDGWLLVPDGSGTLLDRVTKSSTDIYAKPLYGTDETLMPELGTEETAQAVMPIFGLKAGNNAILGIVEEGAALGTVRASSIGGTNLVAAISTTFTITPIDFVDYTGLLNVPTGIIMPKEGAVGGCAVRYHFFNDEEITYSDLANDYREYLIDHGVLKKNNETKTPFYALMLGSLKNNKTVVGIPVEYDEKLTTFEQASEIMDLLAAAGVQNIKTQYKGIANEGLANGGYDRYDLVGALGGKNGYEKMMAYANEKGYTIFPDANILQIYDPNTKSIFNYKKDSARRADNTIATGSVYNPATLELQLWYNHLLVAPDKVSTLLDQFLPRFTAMSNQNALSLGAMGEVLNSSYEKDHLIHRNAAETYYAEALKKAQETVGSIMVEKGNAYTWPYVTDILNLPIGSSMNYQEMESIPFVQMVLHGYINYSSVPINSTSDYRSELLKAIETGSGVSYKLMYAENIVLQDTDFDIYYSYHYADWIEEAGAFYKEVAAALDQVAGAVMIKHEKLQENVFMSTYDNGKAIIVNYGKEAVQVLGQTVAAEGYLVKEANTLG